MLERRARRCKRRRTRLDRRKSLVTRSDRSFVPAAYASERLFHLCDIFGEVRVPRFVREALRERVDLQRRYGSAPLLSIDGETETVGCRWKAVMSGRNSIWYCITARTASRSILSSAWSVEEAWTAVIGSPDEVETDRFPAFTSFWRARGGARGWGSPSSTCRSRRAVCWRPPRAPERSMDPPPCTRRRHSPSFLP